MGNLSFWSRISEGFRGDAISVGSTRGTLEADGPGLEFITADTKSNGNGVVGIGTAYQWHYRRHRVDESLAIGHLSIPDRCHQYQRYCRNCFDRARRLSCPEWKSAALSQDADSGFVR